LAELNCSLFFQPRVFVKVGSFVERIVVGRDVETPNSILAFISGDREEQVEYVEGLVGIGIFLSIMLAIWFLALILLKWQGRDRMGCAAGYAFHDSESDDESVVEARKERGGASGTLFQGDGEDVSVGAAVDPDDSVAMDDLAVRSSRRKSSQSSKSTSLSTSLSASLSKLSSVFARKKEASAAKSPIEDKKTHEEVELHMELDDIVQSTNDQDKVWSLQSIPKAVDIGDESIASKDESTDRKASKKMWGETCLCSPQPEDVERRKFQTRAVFALFAMISIMCCILLITNMYKPLESAALTTGEVVQESAQIVDDLTDVLRVLDEATVATRDVVQSTTLEYKTLCPGITIESFEAQFGFNPQAMINTISTEYRTYVPSIIDALRTAKESGDSVSSMLMDINEAINSVNEYLWIIPLIICITMLIIFSQLALMLAVVYREQKFKDIQTTVPKVESCYAWTVLPLQTIVVVLSWLLVIGFCFGIVVTTDTCIPSFSSTETGANRGRGTPDDVVLAIVGQYMPQRDAGGAEALEVVETLAKQRIATYITGCTNRDGRMVLEDPLAEVIVLQTLLQDSIDEVDAQLSFAKDVLGLDFIENECGPGNLVRSFFQDLTVLNLKFVNLGFAIKTGYNALSCPRINSLYVDAVHGALCTDFATANANGMILFFMVSFSGMVLITLRAAWRSAE
jgi:hypothetical protein